MSKVTKVCDTIPGIDTVALGGLDFCGAVAACPTVQNLKNDSARVTASVEKQTSYLDKVAEENAKLAKELQANEEKDQKQDSQITEINNNISMLKGWNVRQDHKIESLSVKVIRDTVYNNFQEWVANVYIPNCGDVANQYARGSIYINTSRSISAVNATYVNIRHPNESRPCSAEDWQELYYSSPADVLVLLGADPIEIEHRDKTTWTIKLNPDKFARYIDSLEKIDFSKLKITLSEVLGDVVFKGAVTTFKNRVIVEDRLEIADPANVYIGNETLVEYILRLGNQHWQSR